MKTFKNYNDAVEAAEQAFIDTFLYCSGVGVESAEGNVIEFYSKDDPGMDYTFTCIIDDGILRFCKNGGPVKNVTN